MKKERWIPLLVTGIVGIIMLVGLLSNPFRFDPLFGKGYEATFYAYTTSSLHAGDLTFCLTDDGYLVHVGGGIAHYAKLENISFDPDIFTSHCTNYGYWQGGYSPEYICQHIDRAWYGVFQTGSKSGPYFYLLLLDDGQLLCAEGNFLNKYPKGTFVRVYTLEAKLSQAEFFYLWNPYVEKNKDNYRYGNYPTDYFAIWKYIYHKFR